MAFGKRKDGPGGRRSSPREQVMLPAALMSIGASRTVFLLDVSATGAQLQASAPMHIGQEIWLKVPPSDIFGTVRWIEDDHCGVAFDDLLSPSEVEALKARGKVVMLPRLTPEEQMAAAEWIAGVAR